MRKITLLLIACFFLKISAIQAQWEEQPQFPGGQEALYSFIDSVMCYPQEAIDKKIEGRVITNFVVEKNGSITNVEILRGVDPLLDNEALRIVKAMPNNWTPANQSGNIVRVRFILPILFKLNENGEPMTNKEVRAERMKKLLQKSSITKEEDPEK